MTSVIAESSDLPSSGASSGVSAKKVAIRLDPEVYKTAERFASVGGRTVPTQIEYWTKLGQILECSLSVMDIISLLEGTKRLSGARVLDHVELDSDSIIAHVDSVRDDDFSNNSTPDYVYDTDSQNRLRRTDREGNVSFGKVVANKFVEFPKT